MRKKQGNVDIKIIGAGEGKAFLKGGLQKGEHGSLEGRRESWWDNTSLDVENQWNGA